MALELDGEGVVESITVNRTEPLTIKVLAIAAKLAERLRDSARKLRNTGYSRSLKHQATKASSV